MELMVSTKRKVEETTADPETVPVSAEGRLLKSKKVLQQMMSRKHPTTFQVIEPIDVDNIAEEPLQSNLCVGKFKMDLLFKKKRFIDPIKRHFEC